MTAPDGQRAVDHYVAEAWQGAALRGAQAVDGTRTTATLSGLPAGAYQLRVRAVNGFGEGPDALLPATVTGVAATYAGAVTDDAPELYWRLGEKSGTRVADASGHGHVAAYNRPAGERTRAGGLLSDPDGAMADGVVWYGSGYDLIRAPLAAGLPAGGAARTIEAWVWSSAPGGRLVVYGDVDVSVDERAITVAGKRLAFDDDDDRRLTDSKWHQLAVTYADGTLQGYLDGEKLGGPQAATLNTATTGELIAARIAAGSTVYYDELAIYPKALSPAAIAAHFAASGNPPPEDKRAPKPTIDAPAAGATTTTRPKLSGRLGALPGDVQHVSLRLLAGTEVLQQRELDGTDGAWALDVTQPLRVGEVTLEATQRDAAGNIGKATRTFTVANAAPVATLTLDKTGGPLPLTVRADLAGTDADADPLTYELDLGDGTPVLRGTPPAALTHAYSSIGRHTVRLRVSDGTETVEQTATVDARLAEALAADAGDDRVVEAGKPLTFSAAASRPQVGIERYHWRFSDGTEADGATVTHTFASAGAETATLEIGAGTQTSSDTAKITVLAPSPAVIATVSSEGHPVGGADVLAILADGRRISATTGGDGRARLAGLPDGALTLYAWANRMRPGSAEVAVKDGAGSASIALTPGEVASAGLTSHRMTEQEVVAAGIDPHDPANSAVYSFTANIAIGSETVSLSGNMSQNGIACGGGADFQSSCPAGGGGGGYYAYPSFQGGVPLLQWLVIPARVGFLKEFFEISMVVQNLAGPEFTLRGGTASLELPAGLALAPTSTPQSASVGLPDIAGGGDAATTWVVRGDAEGDYSPRARYAATLKPIDLPVTLEARLAAPLHVYGASAMKVVVDTDDHFDDRYPGHVRVGIRNVAPVAIANASLTIPVEGAKGFVAQPLQQRSWTAASIGPGETWFPDAAGDPDDDFIIVPQPSGTVDLTQSFIAGVAGEHADGTELRRHPQVQPAAQAPELTAKRRGDWIVLKWAPGAGATGYQAFGAPNRTTEFGATPLATQDAQTPAAERPSIPAGATSALIHGGAGTAEVALSTVTSARTVLRHPTAEVYDDASSKPTVTISNADTFCASRSGDLIVTASDPDINFASIDVTYNGTTVTHAVSGQNPASTFALGDFPVTSTGTRIVARAHLAIGGQPATAELTVGRRGDTNCDGDVRVAVMGDSYISGEGAYGYLPKTDVHDEPFKNLCHRSPNTWPVRLSRMVAPAAQLIDPEDYVGPQPLPAGDSVAFLACSGSTTINFAGEPHNGDRMAQLDKLLDEDWKTIDLVFMSIGGNDAHFSDIIQTCLILDCAGLSPVSFLSPVVGATEWVTMNNWRAGQLANLPTVGLQVDNAQRAVRAKAPQAEVYQVDYPDPFRPQPPMCNGLSIGGAISDYVRSHQALLAPIFGPGATGLLSLPWDDLGALTLTRSETEWVANTFLPELNSSLRWAADRVIDTDHLLDVTTTMTGHPICSADPWVNGFTRGDDIGGVLGNESFHPNAAGHVAIEGAANAKWGATLGTNPNQALGPAPKRVSAAAVAEQAIGGVSSEVHGPVPGAPLLVAASTGSVEIHDAPAGTDLRVTLSPLNTVVGAGRTDAGGNAEIAIRVPASAAPGTHLVTVWTAAGRRVDVAPGLVTGLKACSEGADADGDGLADACDADPADGPRADLDRDGRTNGVDNCAMVANASQADADGDDEGDACDPDQGADRLATSFRDGGRVVAPSPTVPRSVRARADGAGRAVVEWDAPSTGTVTGYRVTVVGTGRVLDAPADARSLVGRRPDARERRAVRRRRDRRRDRALRFRAGRGRTGGDPDAFAGTAPGRHARADTGPAGRWRRRGRAEAGDLLPRRGEEGQAEPQEHLRPAVQGHTRAARHVHDHTGQTARAEDTHGQVHRQPQRGRDGHDSHRLSAQAPAGAAGRRGRRNRSRVIYLHLALIGPAGRVAPGHEPPIQRDPERPRSRARIRPATRRDQRGDPAGRR